MAHFRVSPKLRGIARLVLPVSVFERIQAIRSRRSQVRMWNRLGITEATKRYVERHGTIVRHGPFSGMIYPIDAALNRHSIPKLLGTYERELHEIVRTIADRHYDCVIDIGSAEGYYAVGMARLLRVPVYAYDPEPAEKGLCSLMARINGVSDLVHMNNLFTPRDISRFAQKRVLLISDCEGYEMRLFGAVNVQVISNWDLLIELHGAAVQRLPALSWTQATKVIGAQPRPVSGHSYQEIDGIGAAEALLSEYRSEQQHWLWCDSTVRR